MLPQGTEDGAPRIEHRELSTEHIAASSQHTAHRTRHRAPSTERTEHRMGERAARPALAAAETQQHEEGTSGRSTGLWPVPIAEVGTWVRDATGQVGIIRDAMEVAGNLAYVVEFEPHATGEAWQCIPARALKGVQL